MHKIEMSPEVLDRIKGFRPALHMFDKLDPKRTAHIIVDLQNGFMEPGATVELPVARDIVPNVNEICKAVRAAGGINVFIRYLIDEPAQVNWSSWFTDFASPQRRKAMIETFGKDCARFRAVAGARREARRPHRRQDALWRVCAGLLAAARDSASARDRHADHHGHRNECVLRIDRA